MPLNLLDSVSAPGHGHWEPPNTVPEGQTWMHDPARHFYESYCCLSTISASDFQCEWADWPRARLDFSFTFRSYTISARMSDGPTHAEMMPSAEAPAYLLISGELRPTATCQEVLYRHGLGRLGLLLIGRPIASVCGTILPSVPSHHCNLHKPIRPSGSCWSIRALQPMHTRHKDGLLQ